MPSTQPHSTRPVRTDKPSFKRWFEDSKIVTDAGDPMVVYHGTPNTFTRFDTFPAYFTCDRAAALAYAQNQYAREGHEGDPVVMEVYLAMKNPKVISADELADLAPDDEGGIDWVAVENLAYNLEMQGFDGMILRGIADFSGMHGDERQTRAYDQYVAFNGNQIKNAVERKPTLDHDDPGLGL